MPSTQTTMQERFNRICRELGHEPAQKKRKKTWAEVQAEKHDSVSEHVEALGRALDDEESEDRIQPYKDPYAIDSDNEEEA